MTGIYFSSSDGKSPSDLPASLSDKRKLTREEISHTGTKRLRKNTTSAIPLLDTEHRQCTNSPTVSGANFSLSSRQSISLQSAIQMDPSLYSTSSSSENISSPNSVDSTTNLAIDPDTGLEPTYFDFLDSINSSNSIPSPDTPCTGRNINTFIFPESTENKILHTDSINNSAPIKYPTPTLTPSILSNTLPTLNSSLSLHIADNENIGLDALLTYNLSYPLNHNNLNANASLPDTLLIDSNNYSTPRSMSPDNIEAFHFENLYSPFSTENHIDDTSIRIPETSPTGPSDIQQKTTDNNKIMLHIPGESPYKLEKICLEFKDIIETNKYNPKDNIKNKIKQFIERRRYKTYSDKPKTASFNIEETSDSFYLQPSESQFSREAFCQPLNINPLPEKLSSFLSEFSTDFTSLSTGKSFNPIFIQDSEPPKKKKHTNRIENSSIQIIEKTPFIDLTTPGKGINQYYFGSTKISPGVHEISKEFQNQTENFLKNNKNITIKELSGHLLFFSKENGYDKYFYKNEKSDEKTMSYNDLFKYVIMSIDKVIKKENIGNINSWNFARSLGINPHNFYSWRKNYAKNKLA